MTFLQPLPPKPPPKPRAPKGPGNLAVCAICGYEKVWRKRKPKCPLHPEEEMGL